MRKFFNITKFKWNKFPLPELKSKFISVCIRGLCQQNKDHILMFYMYGFIPNIKEAVCFGDVSFVYGVDIAKLMPAIRSRICRMKKKHPSVYNCYIKYSYMKYNADLHRKDLAKFKYNQP